ncbi:type VI secretion system protein TssL, long form [Burkholderia stagnalis]|uniref:type VI secretion system protein TssL, long form n=1 Tax=Burkholderia stagnalis TaxID=1503054 RepID=UPI0009BCA24C
MNAGSLNKSDAPFAMTENTSASQIDEALAGAGRATPTKIDAPPENNLERLERVKTARNPLLEASRVLLRALADMPSELAANDAAALRGLLENEVRTMQKLCQQANIRRDHMLGASYCLCTALDEAAMQTAWAQHGDSGNEWIKSSLATTFHKDIKGGDKIYLLIGRLLEEPDEHIHLLEVIYRALSLGFEGRYRLDAHGPRKHEAVRQRLYTEIMSRRGPVPAALSPHWQSDVKRKRQSFYDIPVWITVVVLSVVLLGMYGYFKYELGTRSVAIQKQIAEIGQMTPPPVPAPKLNLKTLLGAEIAAGTVSVDEDASHSAVTFRGDDMFPPGKAAVNASMTPLVAKIAAEIVKVPGKVIVTGHTDNLPIRSRRYPSNQALSEERAVQVMQMLQAAGVPANRLEAVGKGDAEPVGDNRTTQGRAQNRRVSITVAE